MSHSRPILRKKSTVIRPFDGSIFDPKTRALVWVDMEPLLEKERKRCKKTEGQLERATQQLERFRLEWAPEFSRWFSGRFGEKATRVRELEAKAIGLRNLVERVEAEAVMTGCSERTAYARIQEIDQAADKIGEMRSRAREQDFSSQFTDQEYDFWNGKGGEFPPEIEAFLKKRFNQLYGSHRYSRKKYEEGFEAFKQEFRERVLGEGRRGDYGAENWRREEEHAWRHEFREHPYESHFEDSLAPEYLRRKQLYRDLARKLHPDINPEQSLRERDLWYEVQAAHDARNLERLETLAAVVENRSAVGYSRVRSVSLLRSIYEEANRKLKAAQRSIRKAKKEPSWNFAETERDPVKLAGLTARIDFDLTGSMKGLEIAIAEFEEQIEEWKGSPLMA